ncbi:hypothetical protein BDN70DRAFT_798068 [Pholiota conissans]|uniref:Cation efflux protein transmembrane domain-containing protein n=1 Tax=Pholiota conissans TaxID=109636 RepID=A0A9P5ZD09_9AGAR|nr:hypothetical protein BDN70DRAFT_798068 [Pholiota conissans]
MSVQTQQIHRRKSSREEDKGSLISPPPSVEISVPPEHELPSVTISAPPPRSRTQSTPSQSPYGHSRTVSSSTPSAGPYRSSFAARPLNGHASPLRSSFVLPQMNGHSRTRSTSTPFSPVLPSPLSASFPHVAHSPLHTNGSSSSSMSISPPALATSHSASETLDGPSSKQQHHARRHSRMHSRNLSVFFPRPGSLPHTAISEDGSQEVELVSTDEEAPLVPSAGSSVSIPGRRGSGRGGPLTPLGQGFTFGQRPPSSLPMPELMSPSHSASSSSSTASKRGHHHKHSLSHNFFSFLEPTVAPEDLHTQPTPMPMSPWGPISAIPPDSALTTSQSAGFKVPVPPLHEERVEISRSALVASASQFVLGAYMWVVGQQVGSLSVTGLGYWVVFDAFGIGLSRVVPGWLGSDSKGNVSDKERERIRRPYGTGRVETVLMFAQAVYLMFSSVYVCKETIEHLLLSAGGGEGHHHHHGDEEAGLGIDFPIIITFITFISLVGTAFFFENNTKILNITGNRIPSIPTLLRSVWSPSRHTHESPPTSTAALILSNPFVASPLFFCLAILFVALFMMPAQHRMADLALAMIIAGLTFKVAYRACVVLGAVLLQTSPPRGLTSGKMESFLRAMREVERHPHVLHLPAPHIWQLTPSFASLPPSTKSHSLTSPTSHTSSPMSHKPAPPAESLVVTLELHVREDLGDDDVLKLTRWAWERCVGALAMGSLREMGEVGEVGGPEVTVGVVRG